VSWLAELLGPRHTFEGGLFLADYKSGTAKRPIENLPVHETLHVPLTAHAALSTRAIVQPGEHVRAGQRLAQPLTPDALPVHAPVTSEVVRFEPVWTPLDGLLPGVVLRPDLSDETPPSRSMAGEDSFIASLADHGVFCPVPRVALHTLLHQAAERGVTDLIVNAMETEPYLVSDLRTLVEQPGRLIDATAEIADALGAMNVYFALPYRHRRVVKRIEAEARGRFIDVIALSHKYPQCDPVVLTKTLLDREIPPGSSPLEVGVLVLPLAVLRMAADALLDDTPLTHAIVTVAGDAVERPGAYRVAIGTSIRQLAQRVGLLDTPRRVLHGGPLTGVTLSRAETVITGETRAVLMFAQDNEPDPVPCIRCGWCVDDCPVGLDPSTLLHLETRQNVARDERQQLAACIACGLCSHVCPSHLPLAQSLRNAAHRFTEDAP
jgi:electron transport complex protein RnfC